MKKKMHFLAAALLLSALLLAGCTPDDPISDTTPTVPDASAASEPTEASTMPVEEDVIYFSNGLEMNRLYSIRRDGTDLTLVLDEQCYSVRQQGDTVYFLGGTSLKAYHIPTGTCSVIVEDPISYTIEGDHLVYAVLNGQFGGIDLLHMDLTTGKNTVIASMDSIRFWFGNGYVYYSRYDYNTGMESLHVYDLEVLEAREITHDFHYHGSLTPVEGGVYFEAYSDTEEGWYYAAADGSVLEKQENLPPDLYELISISGDGYLCLCRNTDDYASSVHLVGQDGTDTVIAEWDDSVSLFFTPVAQDCWLMEQHDSVGWGSTNEYGYYENYATQIDYKLLTADGTLTSLDATGSLGAMFADGDFPLLDSSTARIPVTNALYELFVMNYGYEGPAPICSTTHGAWLNIADGQVDLALLAAPTEEEQTYLDEMGVSVDMKLYGGDGLVFIGNAENPVTDLTHEQILGIYRGEITNWNEVGGPDHPIIVYYRDEQSGSQRLFKNLVFKDLDVPDFEAMHLEGRNFWLMDDMSSIVDVILAEPYAIGYSIMTYLDEVYAEENLRVFSVSGVTPSPDTVRDSSYRYHTQGYLVIRSDEPADSPARRLFDWFGCPISDDLLNMCSVSPLHDDPQS